MQRQYSNSCYLVRNGNDGEPGACQAVELDTLPVPELEARPGHGFYLLPLPPVGQGELALREIDLFVEGNCPRIFEVDHVGQKKNQVGVKGALNRKQ